MTSSNTVRTRVNVASAFVAPFVAAVAMVPFRESLANAAAALVLVVVVVAVAVTGNRATGVIASVSAALWFDFFLTAPYQRFAISQRHDVETTISLLVVGVIVTELASRSRHHRDASNEESRFVGMIRELTAISSGAAPAGDVIEFTTRSLLDVLELRECRFDERLEDPPLARILATGEVAHVGLSWPANSIGIPGPRAEIVAAWRGRTVGRFVLTPTPGLPVSLERRSVAATLVALTAARISDERADSRGE